MPATVAFIPAGITPAASTSPICALVKVIVALSIFVSSGSSTDRSTSLMLTAGSPSIYVVAASAPAAVLSSPSRSSTGGSFTAITSMKAVLSGELSVPSFTWTLIWRWMVSGLSEVLLKLMVSSAES